MSTKEKEFKLSRDYKLVRWKETLWYNGMRAFFAGIGIVIFKSLLASMAGGSAMSTGGFEASDLIISPLMVVMFLIPGAFIFSWFSFIPFFGFFSRVCGFFIALGDPFVFLLKMAYAPAVPTDSPPIFDSHSPLIYVLSPFDEY